MSLTTHDPNMTVDTAIDELAPDDRPPVVTLTATGTSATTGQPATDLDADRDDDLDDDEASSRPRRPWFSGWCTPGPCQDGRWQNKAGEPVRHCLYRAENGEKVMPRTLFCACSCHDDVRDAADPSHPDNGPIPLPTQTAGKPGNARRGKR